jgi:HD-like signal output (HDOD) protein/CheY-like chemotaxis protein
MKRLLFVDDEPNVLQGLRRQLRGLAKEWQMSFVESGPEALELMAAAPADVIVSDMKMPGMDGGQLLTEVMKRYPHTVRLVLSGQADREAILQLVGPAHQYLSKPCNPEELRAAITRALSLRDLLASEQLKRLASRIRCLPSLPALHLQLTEELRREDSSLDHVGEIISQDIGMTTKILQLVNSAFFGLPHPVADAKQAASYLGLANLRALVLSLEVFSQFDQRTILQFSIEDLARHCRATGLRARRLAELENCPQSVEDQYFLAGLLHDVGELILAADLPEQYTHVLHKAAESGEPVWQVEQAEFEATHAELGAYLLGLWGMPNPVVEAVALHHKPAASSACGFSPVLAVHVADALTPGRVGPHSGHAENQIDMAYLTRLGLDHRLPEWKHRCSEDHLELGRALVASV